MSKPWLLRSALQSSKGPEFFSGFLRNCINCDHNCEDHSSFDFISAVLIWFISYTSITFISWTHNWPAPNISGFIAQLVKASHQYREVTGSNPVKSWIFSGFLRNCTNCVHNCEDHSSFDEWKTFQKRTTSRVVPSFLVESIAFDH